MTFVGQNIVARLVRPGQTRKSHELWSARYVELTITGESLSDHRKHGTHRTFRRTAFTVCERVAILSRGRWVNSRSATISREFRQSKDTETQLKCQHCACWWPVTYHHYDGVIMGAMASQITSLTIVYSTVFSDADQRKHQSSKSLAFVRGFHRGLVNSPHKWPVTRKMFPFHDVIMMVGHLQPQLWPNT